MGLVPWSLGRGSNPPIRIAVAEDRPGVSRPLRYQSVDHRAVLRHLFYPLLLLSACVLPRFETDVGRGKPCFGIDCQGSSSVEEGDGTLSRGCP